ncbi:M23 family metallopeptidase [Microbacterium sp. 2FI]|uniref:M23 family metallopeptidase n=1 Tax=Microbacterium sp. 2FI TaxID=2502193 RepID=UPI0020162E68|nr:M23 family metallopeptidase [Microbacterium sp. 2FI]
MPFDALPADPAPTRRSSRTAATPVHAAPATPGVSRAELRRRSAESGTARPTVWGAERVVTEPVAVAEMVVPAEPVVVVVEPVVAPEPVIELPVAEEAVIEMPVIEEPPATAAAPLGRRARRASTTLPDAVLTPAEPFELLEPEAVPEPAVAEVPEPEAEPAMAAGWQASSSVDEFEAAARLFSFTGETPVQTAAADAEPADAERSSHTHTAPRRPRASAGSSFRRVAAASFSVGVMGIVGLVTVGMTMPAEAVAAASGVDNSVVSVIAPLDSDLVIDEDEIQAYVAPAGAENDSLQRAENYSTTTTAELASEAGIRNFSNLFHNDPNSAIQWPFAVGVTMSYGFGWRSGRMHEGIDFTPGAGSPIQAIADGTVRVASEAGGAYGVHVIIDHMVDGQLVSSHYAHMQYGSMQVSPGQKVTVGTILGRTGNTGRSYGAHTHFEILMNGTTAIDPFPWLKEHAGG